VGAVAGGIYGAVLSATGSGKDGGQQIRDKWRKNMQEAGFISEDFTGTLADGTVIDWNDINGEQGSGIKDMKFDDPIVGAAVAYGDMLATAQGATGKARANIAGELAKAAIFNANGDPAVVEANFKHFAEQLGLDSNTIHARIAEIQAQEVGEDGDEKENELFEFAKVNATHLFGAPSATPTVGPGKSEVPEPIQTPRKESNGMYRVSPGVYSRTPTAVPKDLVVVGAEPDEKYKVGRSPYVRKT
jgi:hypothetical protein